MRYEIVTTHRFEKAFKRCLKRGYPMEALRVVLNLLAENGSLHASYRPHKLSGFPNKNIWECHIESDWLLVWEQDNNQKIMLLLDTGTHSDIF